MKPAKAPKRGTCEECDGKGHFFSRLYPSGRAAQVKHTCPHCQGRGKFSPGEVTHALDCTGCGGIYRCAGCRKWCGWCFGASDDMPEHCDDCWAKAHPAPKRGRAMADDPWMQAMHEVDVMFNAIKRDIEDYFNMGEMRCRKVLANGAVVRVSIKMPPVKSELLVALEEHNEAIADVVAARKE